MIIIHGENQLASRAFLIEAKQNAQKKNLEIVSLEGSEIVLGDILQYVNSTNLLGSTNCVVVEGFFSRRPSNDKKKIIEYLEANTKEEIIFWDGKDLGMQVKNFPLLSVKKFDLPKTVFKFLDTFAMSDLIATLQNTPAELIFSLLVGQIRKLIMIKEDVIELPAWQQGKLKLQSSKYSSEKLLQMHQELLEIDFKNKTSVSSLNLSSALELWVMGLTFK